LDLKENNHQISVSNPVNITSRKGYDNQPFFINNHQLLYTAGIGSQTDIMRYDVKSHKANQLTNTPESEYSPTLTLDGKYFSTVRVEKDSTQRLWKSPLHGGKPTLVTPNVDSIGYHCWIDANTLALFILTKPFSLQIVNIRTGMVRKVAGNIGRCTARIPGENAISLVVMETATTGVIKKLNLKDFSITTITKTYGESEDYAWTPSGTLITGHNGILYKFNPKTDKDWKMVTDLNNTPIKNFGRIAISPDGKRIVLVSKSDTE
jgi:hypothetical protein